MATLQELQDVMDQNGITVDDLTVLFSPLAVTRRARAIQDVRNQLRADLAAVENRPPAHDLGHGGHGEHHGGEFGVDTATATLNTYDD